MDLEGETNDEKALDSLLVLPVPGDFVFSTGAPCAAGAANRFLPDAAREDIAATALCNVQMLLVGVRAAGGGQP